MSGVWADDTLIEKAGFLMMSSEIRQLTYVTTGCMVAIPWDCGQSYCPSPMAASQMRMDWNWWQPYRRHVI